MHCQYKTTSILCIKKVKVSNEKKQSLAVIDHSLLLTLCFSVTFQCTKSVGLNYRDCATPTARLRVFQPPTYLDVVLLALSAVISGKVNTWHFVSRVDIFNSMLLQKWQSQERLNWNHQPSITFPASLLAVPTVSPSLPPLPNSLLVLSSPPDLPPLSSRAYTRTHSRLPLCPTRYVSSLSSWQYLREEATCGPSGESADSCVHTLPGGLQLFTPLPTSTLLRAHPPSLPVPFSSAPAVCRRYLSVAFSHRDCVSASLHLC